MAEPLAVMQKNDNAMRKNTLIILIFILGQLSAYCQMINGHVTDENNNPLPFVNIGVVEKNKGTVSTVSGKFHLDISEIEETEILRFSSVGYENVDYEIRVLRQLEKNEFLNIILDKKLYSIDEVVILSKQNKPFFIGSKKKGNTTWAWYNIMNGAEIGRLITNNKEVFLRNFYFHIGKTNCDSILYRLKIYNVLNQQPDSIVNKEEIFFTSKTKKGWECINLIDYGIKVDSDIIITLETIKGWNETDDKSVYLSKIQKKGLSYKRLFSWDSWMKFTGEMSYKLEVSEL